MAQEQIKLIELLQRKSLGDELRDWYSEMRHMAHLHLAGWEEAEDSDSVPDDVSLDHAYAVELDYGWSYDFLEQVFREQILEKLTRPYPITVSELAQSYIETVVLPSEDHHAEEIDGLFPAFLSRVYWLTTKKIAKPIAIAALRSNQASQDRMHDLFTLIAHVVNRPATSEIDWSEAYDRMFPNAEGRTLHESSHISIRLVGPIPAIADEEWRSKLSSPENWQLTYVMLTGNCSPGAMQAVRDELGPVLQSILRTLEVFVTVESNVKWLCDLPQVADRDILQHSLFVKHCLDAYYGHSSGNKKKDTFDRRIRNAIILLAESDRQESDAIAIALAVTAIEALLSSGKSEISRKLGDVAATLLESDPKLRENLARFTRFLYTTRSNVLHGSETESISRHRGQARALASITLFAIVNCLVYQRRAGYDQIHGPADLVNELDKHRFEVGLLPGVPDLSHIEKPWRTKLASGGW